MWSTAHTDNVLLSFEVLIVQVASVKLGQEASEAAAAAVLEARAGGASEEEVKVRILQ